MVADAELDGRASARLVGELLGDPERLAAMAAASAASAGLMPRVRVVDEMRRCSRGRGAA